MDVGFSITIFQFENLLAPLKWCQGSRWCWNWCLYVRLQQGWPLISRHFSLVHWLMVNEGFAHNCTTRKQNYGLWSAITNRCELVRCVNLCHWSRWTIPMPVITQSCWRRWDVIERHMVATHWELLVENVTSWGPSGHHGISRLCDVWLVGHAFTGPDGRMGKCMKGTAEGEDGWMVEWVLNL